MRPRFIAPVVALAGTTIALSATAQAALKVTWMPGVTSPGTPARLDRVGVIKVGPAHARNVLAIEPGTSAAGAYFVPLARWIVSRAKNWQVWSVERRENLLEDQSELNLAKRGGATATQLFDYYLAGVTGADGSEWYFPQRLSVDLAAVGNATASGAQRALGLRSTLGRDLPGSLRIYAFGARIGGRTILGEAATLARQSHLPRRQVTLVDRHATYAHNDPIGAYPRNAFFSRLIPFLRTVSATAS
jgi:hypothetical protein